MLSNAVVHSSDDLLEALRVAHSTETLKIVVKDSSDVEGSHHRYCPRHHHHRHHHSKHYSALAAEVGAGRRKAAEMAARLLLGKQHGHHQPPQEQQEPEWFKAASQKVCQLTSANFLHLHPLTVASKEYC